MQQFVNHRSDSGETIAIHRHTLTSSLLPHVAAAPVNQLAINLPIYEPIIEIINKSMNDLPGAGHADVYVVGVVACTRDESNAGPRLNLPHRLLNHAALPFTWVFFFFSKKNN